MNINSLMIKRSLYIVFSLVLREGDPSLALGMTVKDFDMGERSGD